MYIIGLNSKKGFYFISKEEERTNLEEKGILVLDGSYERITIASNVIKTLNEELTAKHWGEYFLNKYMVS
jgi:hypothetical protein